MTIKLHGKEYVEVKDRVASAHAEESYSMLKEESFEMGGRAYCRVYIEVKGKQYIGTAEIKFNAKANTPDGMSPFECGETSALGRALGFAGYGVVESIASADEVARNAASNGHEEQNGHSAPPKLLLSAYSDKMNDLLLEFERLAPDWCRQRGKLWHMELVKGVLQIGKNQQFPNSFSADEEQRLELYVASKRQAATSGK